jgi:hypothetical protein
MIIIVVESFFISLEFNIYSLFNILHRVLSLLILSNYILKIEYLLKISPISEAGISIWAEHFTTSTQLQAPD